MKRFNKSFKKNILILNIIFLIPILTSCIGGRELDTLGIVIATGLDIEDGKIIVTNEVINPASGTESKSATTQESTLFVQGVGETLAEAIAQTTLTFDRELYYPHNYIIIFGEEVVKQGFGTYIDILTRSNEQREQAYLLIAKNSKAYDIMGINSGMATSPGRYIYDIIREDIYNGMSRTITINDFFKYYYRGTEGFTFGVARVVKKPQINKSKSGTELDVICVEGGAVFKEDKLVGYFTGQEMIGFNLIVDELKSTVISFKTPKYLKDKSDYITRHGEESSIQVFKNKTKRQIKLIDGKLHLFIDMAIRGTLREDTQGLDISQPGVLEEMEKACAREVESIVSKTMDKAQKELNVDTFSIGGLVHKKYPKIWKEIKSQWDEIFRDLDYTVNAKVTFTDMGFTNAPPNIRKGK